MVDLDNMFKVGDIVSHVVDKKSLGIILKKEKTEFFLDAGSYFYRVKWFKGIYSGKTSDHFSNCFRYEIIGR